MTLKYFFYHQIFFQDSAQTEIPTVKKLKYLQWKKWNTYMEKFSIGKPNPKYIHGKSNPKYSGQDSAISRI